MGGLILRLYQDDDLTPGSVLLPAAVPAGPARFRLGSAQHYGLTGDEAQRFRACMADLCVQASPVLEAPFYPLGLLGFDVLVEAGSHRIWLLEANAVPGWRHSNKEVERLARSQVDFARSLTGFHP